MTGPIYTPGMPPLNLPPSLLGSGATLPPDETITPEAMALAAEEQKRLELEDAERRVRLLTRTPEGTEQEVPFELGNEGQAYG